MSSRLLDTSSSRRPAIGEPLREQIIVGHSTRTSGTHLRPGCGVTAEARSNMPSVPRDCRTQRTKERAETAAPCSGCSARRHRHRRRQRSPGRFVGPIKDAQQRADTLPRQVTVRSWQRPRGQGRLQIHHRWNASQVRGRLVEMDPTATVQSTTLGGCRGRAAR